MYKFMVPYFDWTLGDIIGTWNFDSGLLIDEVSDKIPETEEEEEVEVVATVQQAVSYFTSNNNKVGDIE